MPCYQVRTVSVAFKIGNIDLLKKAIEKMEGTYLGNNEEFLNFRTNDGRYVNINFKKETISSFGSNLNFTEKGLATFSNSIKRAYSEVVINEVAKRQKWMQRKMGEGRFQLQRF